ncbi:hypothetical protein HMI54_007987 [Coelomomyces lativittatus]|nr:hypothetical protein HMI54_007987 [Coelomomyces lativittatus]KAJ1504276.1 hypothetical protein HMI56_001703 [Coelomomyces lativittatus]KAJ1506426.1 hypothetical protein HMI55_001185 [Coelomomyces lativittatus]
MLSKTSDTLLFLAFFMLLLQLGCYGQYVGISQGKVYRMNCPSKISFSLDESTDKVKSPLPSPLNQNFIFETNGGQVNDRDQLMGKKETNQVFLEPTEFLEEMKQFSTLYLSSAIKDIFTATSPLGLYLLLGRFVHIPKMGSSSYKELTERWKFNPEKVLPKTLAAFDKYLETNQIQSVNLLYHPKRFCHPSPKLQKLLDDSNMNLFHHKIEVADKIREVTQGNIKEYDFNSNIELLLNVLYLNLGWYIGFYRNWELSKFHINDNEYLDVSYMEVTEKFSFIDNPEYKAVKLDFVKDPKAETKERLEDFSAYLVTSKNGKQINEIWEEAHELLSRKKREEAHVKLPAFRTEQEIKFGVDMFPALLKPRNKDFPDLCGGAKGIDLTVKQKVFICADEKGSIAGAVTGIHSVRWSMRIDPPSFVFDKPFYYLIAGTKVSTPLFVSYVKHGMTEINEGCS